MERITKKKSLVVFVTASIPVLSRCIQVAIAALFTDEFLSGDELQIVTAGSDNFVKPQESGQGIKGFVTGTVTYQLLGAKNQSMPFTM